MPAIASTGQHGATNESPSVPSRRAGRPTSIRPGFSSCFFLLYSLLLLAVLLLEKGWITNHPTRAQRRDTARDERLAHDVAWH